MRSRFSLLVLCLAGLLRAQPPAAAPPPPWSAGGMTVWDTQPYKGAEGRWVTFPFLSYQGERLEWQGPRILYWFHRDSPWKLAAHATLQFPAYEEDDSAFLEGMGNRAYTLLTGLLAHYTLHPKWDLHSRLHIETLGEYHGVQWTQGLRRSLGSPRSPFPLFGSLELNLVIQDENWTGYFVGVPDEKVRPGRPAYTPGFAVFPAIRGTAVYRIRPAWSLFTTARFDFLGPEWLDSPLIENEHRLQLLAALQYRF